MVHTTTDDNNTNTSNNNNHNDTATSSSNDDDLMEYCKSLPKIELHAHINGCIRPSTLNELVMKYCQKFENNKNNTNTNDTKSNMEQQQQPSETIILYYKKLLQNPTKLNTIHFSFNNLKEGFQIFSIIHEVITTTTLLKRIVKETIIDFENDNCKYLELRTTPKQLKSTNNHQNNNNNNNTNEQNKKIIDSYNDYISSVIEIIKECNENKNLDIQVRLILSINRSESLQKAYITLQLLKEWKLKEPTIIVGIDFSGNPTSKDSNFQKFISIFNDIKKEDDDLKTTIHFAEEYNNDDDVNTIIQFNPNRLGHACCLSFDQWNHVHQMNNTSIEICLTSNIITRPELKSHCICCKATIQNILSNNNNNNDNNNSISSSSSIPTTTTTTTTRSCTALYCTVCNNNDNKKNLSMTTISGCLCGYSIHPLRFLLEHEKLEILNSTNYHDDTTTTTTNDNTSTTGSSRSSINTTTTTTTPTTKPNKTNDNNNYYHPICICTDDPGIFETTLSLEYYRIGLACQLSKDQLKNIAKSAIYMIFDESMKLTLLQNYYS